MTVPAAALWQVAKIDPVVISGVSSASKVVNGEPSVADSYAGFWKYVNEQGESLLKPGNESRLVGYVGEQQVAGLLEGQGKVIEMASTPNNPGWDLLVGDVEANVKTYQDASNAVPYAEASPDTHFYLPEDAANQVAMNNITYLAGFNAEEMRSALHESLEAGANLVSGAYIDDAIFAGVPVVLLFSTTLRQMAAIKEGKRVQDAILDGTITVAAKGLGAFAGLQAGALAGAQVDAACGFSTFGAGAALGAVVGLVGGRTLAGKALDYHRELQILEAEKDLQKALERHGRDLYEAGAGEALQRAIDAPVARAEESMAQLAHHVDRDRRSVQWWLWPRADQVLRESALMHAREDVRTLRAECVADRHTWRSACSGEKPEHLALACLNVPALAKGLDVSTKEVAKAKGRATARRDTLAGR